MANTEQDSIQSENSVPRKPGNVYEIRVKGLLDAHWQQWFEGLTLTSDESYEDGQGSTLIVAEVTDQPALHGLLEKVRDLNLTLISVRKLVDEPDAAGHHHLHLHAARRTDEDAG